uniref:Uncharacterized protein n=1 Tax=Siphoviridae sp. ctBCr48 TaxID=2827802 RepID=A0A8S5SIH8_9CAUD|nr:MAG TPA: hypothetical protein [Siphoviridae sp. ctBCr48]
MKNHAGFKVGDKVVYLYIPGGIDKLKGRIGVVKMIYKDACSVTFKNTEKYLTPETYAIDNKYLSKVIGKYPDTDFTPHEMANDKDNVWAISIKPAPFDRERTVADLIVNGRIVDTITVSRWHDEDKYDVGMAAYEVIKKMFDIKDKRIKKVDDTVVKEPEWFTGKIICTYGDSGEFTKGKIYQVNHGVLFNNDNFRYGYFESVEDINKRLYSQFIEVVE